MSEQTTSASTGQQELQEELDRHQEEILRLRDLLIGKDAELGAAKGRLAELEDPRMQLVAAKRQIVARAMARLGGLVLRLRGNS
jgi:chromosome segregation ATPase